MTAADDTVHHHIERAVDRAAASSAPHVNAIRDAWARLPHDAQQLLGFERLSQLVVTRQELESS